MKQSEPLFTTLGTDVCVCACVCVFIILGDIQISHLIFEKNNVIRHMAPCDVSEMLMSRARVAMNSCVFK